MSNFWKVDSKLAIAQRSVAVPSENGLAYTERGKIVIKVEPTVEYFLPSESYVSFRIKLRLGGTAKTRLQLNDRIGGHSIINHIRILSGTGVLLASPTSLKASESINDEAFGASTGSSVLRVTLCAESLKSTATERPHGTRSPLGSRPTSTCESRSSAAPPTGLAAQRLWRLSS